MPRFRPKPPETYTPNGAIDAAFGLRFFVSAAWGWLFPLPLFYANLRETKGTLT